MTPSLPERRPGPDRGQISDPEPDPDPDPVLPRLVAEQKRTFDPATVPGTTTDAETGTKLRDEIVEADDSKLSHSPATATEELDEVVASKTDDEPEKGTSPGAG